MAPKPINQMRLNKILESTHYNEKEKEDFLSRVTEYNEAVFQLGELKRTVEWKLILEPDLFKEAEKKLTSARKDLKSGHVLDTKLPNWEKHMRQYHEAVKKIKEPSIDKEIKEEFKLHFEGDAKKKADEFIESYNEKIAALEQEREELHKQKDKNGNSLYDPIMGVMDAEIEKQLKIVQAHMIQAMQAVTIAEKAEKLSLAKAALGGISLTLVSSGLGLTAAAAVGSVVPVWGTITAGVIGGVVGGIYGGIKAYRDYEVAKATLKARVDRVLGAITEYPKSDMSTPMNPGMAQLKSQDTFDWLIGGPREADYNRMHEKYKASGRELSESEQKNLDIMLQSKFAEARGAYFLMLQDMVREGAADAALQVASGLTPAPPFDPYSALIISSQFTIMCSAQIGTARAMANLDPIEGMYTGHIPVKGNKELLHEAVAGLASNAESLIALAHQINICTTIEQDLRTEMLADIRDALDDTIKTYNEVVTTHNLPLQKDLVEALKMGMSIDIKNQGLKITVDNEEHTASTKHKTSKQEKDAYASCTSILKYLKSEAVQGTSAVFHHIKPKINEKRNLEKALSGADYFMNVVVGPGLGNYVIATSAFGPSIIDPNAPQKVELGHTGTTIGGFASGMTLGVLALACGVGSVICGIKADKEGEKICVLGNVAERRHTILNRLHHSERGSAILVQRTDDELRILLDNPEYQLRLFKTQSVGLALYGPDADRARNLSRTERATSLRTVGTWSSKERESHRSMPPAHKKSAVAVMNDCLECLADLPRELREEMNAFDEKHQESYSLENHKENIKKLHEEVTLYIELMTMIVNAASGLPDGTDPKLVDMLDDVLSQLNELEKMAEEKYPSQNLEKQEQNETKLSANDFQIKRIYDQIETFKSNIPEGPKDLRGEVIDNMGLK